jgi:RimK family alpha-L-glutamate ligase
MRVALIAQRRSETNARLASSESAGPEWMCLTASEAQGLLESGDVALGRLDVLPSLDGVDEGLWVLGELAALGVRVLNGPSALLAAHDKLLTARLLQGAGLPHPRTRLATAGKTSIPVDGPVVVKPRFGSWGREVVRCDDRQALEGELERLAGLSWFKRQGALVQDLVEPEGYDVRVLVAGGVVVGAIRREALPGEWRTNVALGACRVAVDPPDAARVLAVQAAEAAGADLIGVDLLPDGEGGWTILELNGAVEFTDAYSLDRDVFAAARFELARAVLGAPALSHVAAADTLLPPDTAEVAALADPA